jgi:diguanylate cyclase (GGDEF)-like protein
MSRLIKNATLVSLLLTGRRGTDIEISNAILGEHRERHNSLLFTGICGALSFSLAFWFLNPELRVFSWFSLMAIMVATFYFLGRRLPTVINGTKSVDSAHLSLFLAVSVALGSGWGIGGMMFFREQIEYEMFLAMVLCSVSVVGAMAFSTYLSAALLFIICALTPSILLLIASTNVFLHVLGFAGIAYAAIALWFALVANQTGLRGFSLSHRNSELVAALQETNKELEHKNDALHYALAKIEEVANKDELTGCFNRRYLMESLRREAVICSRDYRPFTLLIIDVDYFKIINDTHGHLVGDRALAELGQTLRLIMRSMDTLARFGGEEFACMLPGTTLEEGSALADRIRHVISTQNLMLDVGRLSLTVSIGVAQWHSSESIQSVIQRADQALYRAKAAGRNCIASAESPSSGPAMVVAN